ncbi:chitin synthase-domain-containing protein [Cubamyces lactineus]|nr:chitin synthase-domain-containing protein [Cubamyces lactineus]
MIWLTYTAWKVVEDILRAQEKELKCGGDDVDGESVIPDDTTEYTHQEGSLAVGPGAYYGGGESKDNLLLTRTGTNGTHYHEANTNASYPKMPMTPSNPDTPGYVDADGWGSEWDKKGGGTPPDLGPSKEGDLVAKAPNTVEEVPTSRSRRNWLYVVWLTTWWIPLIALSKIGRMKRPNIQLAWREKVTIFWLVFLFNGIVIFYIIEFGHLLCPDFNKAWSLNEVNQHTGDDDFWVTIQGTVYDVSNFIHGDHSDVQNLASNGADTSTSPFHQSSCAPQAMHKSGPEGYQGSKLSNINWYTKYFLPKIRQFTKGPLVWDKKTIQAQASDPDNQRLWAIYDNAVYDLSDYVYTQSINSAAEFSFLNQDIVDITKTLNNVLAGLDTTTCEQNMNCISNLFYYGKPDFRKTARCQVQNILLLVFSIILMVSIGIKFLAALQLTPKRMPEMLDKFVLCQVPCYTEGKESLRHMINSLAALNYDDKRKLIFINCDGNIISTGNDRTTPRIVLDILGVDPKLNPDLLLYKAIGEGSRHLNYGEVYSGLYEFEGHVVPYIVVVKVGKPTERTKPGNRGKRDSQILVMQYLNRVHFDAPMAPLELEIYHQMRNVIGIDPAFYEYIFTVNADTTVTPDSLNRLVACAADDSSIIGICGETKLDNEEGSWWTMIQVYKYYISHHLSKAFESLFGSVTCLPGCFSMYRIRTADKGWPIIISNRVIEEYAEPIVDTLHKKNLFSLGEDRFPHAKFTPDAVAHTIAPESWRVLFSQRRRWINSTVHNLCELVFLPELFGFCCFSMRFLLNFQVIGSEPLAIDSEEEVDATLDNPSESSAFDCSGLIHFFDVDENLDRYYDPEDDSYFACDSFPCPNRYQNLQEPPPGNLWAVVPEPWQVTPLPPSSTEEEEDLESVYELSPLLAPTPLPPDAPL